MLLVCLGYRDGTMKAPKQFHASSGVQWQLKKAEWLTEGLRQHHCPEEVSGALRKIKNRTSPALRLAHFCYGWSLDVCIPGLLLNGHAAVILEPAVNMDVDAAASIRKASFIFDASGSPFPNPNKIQIHSVGAQPVAVSVDAVNRLLNLSPSDDWQTLHRSVVGLWMPDPLLFLLKRGSWAGLLCQQRWLEGWRNENLRQLFAPMNFPPNAWLEQLKAQNLLHAHIPDETSSCEGYLNPASAASMAYTLRKHAPPSWQQLLRTTWTTSRRKGNQWSGT
eukprot:6470875-Amphidinium_carterae.1